MFLSGINSDDLYEYRLTTQWDLSTASQFETYDISTITGTPRGLYLTPGGDQLYVVDDDAPDRILAFDLASEIATTTDSNAFANLALTGGNTTFTGPASTTGTMTIESGVGTTTFNASSTYTFQNIDWSGTSTDDIVLRSSASGTPWYLDVPGSQINVDFVDVADSDATDTSSGIEACESTDSGRNVNWTFGGVCEGGNPWNDTDWTLFDVITIKHENIDEPLTDFPIYVDLADLSPTFWSTIVAGGGDIRVTTDDGTPVELAREVVSASTTAETGELHFKADYLSEVIDTSFRIYYNGVDQDYNVDQTYGAQNVWSNGFVLVHHMNEDPGVVGADGYLDSTQFNHNGTASGTIVTADSVTGRLGQSIDFNSDGDMLILATSSEIEALSALTVSAWAYPTEGPAPAVGRIVSKWDGGTSDDYMLGYAGGDYARCRVDFGTQSNIDSSNTAAANMWHYMTCNYDDAASEYIDVQLNLEKTIDNQTQNGSVT
ncbi:MAG TPA: hypothetical protein VKP88_08625, partial [Candidatus Paceibacterota bacterium]|nr:hypothetical protein [Candidatus Paceibacterota bacterium]